MAKKITEQDIIRNFEKMSEYEPSKEATSRDIEKVRRMLNERKPQVSPERENVWRIIMQNKWTKTISAAVVFIAILIGISNLPQSQLSAAELLKKVSKNMSNIKWAKTTSKTFRPGEEKFARITSTLTDVKNKRIFLIYEEGYLHQMDYKKKVWSVYRPEDNSMVIKELEGEWVGPEMSVKSVIEKLETEGFEVRESEEIHDGITMTVIEYDEVLNNISHDPDKYMSVMGFDGKIVKTITCKLIINTDRMELSSGQITYLDPENNPISTIISEVEILESGPSDIYELGVPKDVKIINELPGKRTKEIRDKISRYRNAFLKDYIAVCTESVIDNKKERIIEAMVIYCKGKKLRVDDFSGYARGEKLTGQHLDILQTSVDHLKPYVQTNKPVEIHSVAIYDGLWQHRLEKHEEKLVLRKKQRRPDGDSHGDDDIDDFGWRTLWRLNKPEHMYEDEFSKDNGLIAMELTSQWSAGYLPSRQVLYVDPAKDYLFRRYVSEKILDAPWQIDQIKNNTKEHEQVRIYDVVEYAQTLSGQWYPKEITIQGYDAYIGKRKHRSDFNRVSRIYLIEENPQLAEELFDPQILE